MTSYQWWWLTDFWLTQCAIPLIFSALVDSGNDYISAQCFLQSLCSIRCFSGHLIPCWVFILYAIVFAKPNWIQCVTLVMFDSHRWCIIVPVCQFFRNVKNSQVYAVCQQGDGGDCRTMDSKVVYIVGKDVMELRQKSKGICNKLFSYNLVSGYTMDLSRLKLNFHSMYFDLSEGFLSSSLGIKNSKMYNEEAKEIVCHNRFSITEPPADPQRCRFCFISINGDVYIIGGMDKRNDSPTLSVARFSLADQNWTELDHSPRPRILSSVARFRFPLDVLRCHLHCPHCPLFMDRDELLSEYSGDYDSSSGDNINEYGDIDNNLDTLWGWWWCCWLFIWKRVGRMITKVVSRFAVGISGWARFFFFFILLVTV